MRVRTVNGWVKRGDLYNKNIYTVACLETVDDQPVDLVEEFVAGLLPVGHLDEELQVLHAKNQAAHCQVF